MTAAIGRVPTAPAIDRGFRARPRSAEPASAAARRGWAWRYRVRLATTDSLVVGIAITAGLIGGDPRRGLPFALLLAVTWSVALEGYRSRDRRVVGTGSSEYKRVVGSTVLAFGSVAIAGLVFDLDDLRPFYLFALPIGAVGLVLSRWLWRQWLTAKRARRQYLSRALVLGPPDDALDVALRIERSRGIAYTVVGAIVDGHPRGTLRIGERDVPMIPAGAPVVSAVRAASADALIVVGQPSGDSGFVRDISWQLEETATELVLAAGLTDVAGPRIHIRPVEGLPLMHVELPNFEGGKHIIKRAFDVAVSAVALLLTLPVFAAIAVAVKLGDGGPALFRQERVGRDGRIFAMLKFRSMVTTAERDLGSLAARNEGAGVLFKMRDDPRVTPIGRVLRKYSLDELPQLWNILRGDMSIVGPRPPLSQEVSRYEKHVCRRLYIKPGLTGLWQVNGRSNLSWEESVRLDLYYVANWSLATDLVIIWRTVKVVLRPVGAY